MPATRFALGYSRFGLRGLECQDRDLRGAVEAEGEADGADATVDVELHLVEAEVAFYILHSHGWKHKRSDEGQADLAAVGVAGEHEVDQWRSGMKEDVVGVVGLVSHEDDRCAGGGRDGEIEVGVTGAGVVDSAEPEAFSVAFDGDVLVDQDRGAFAGESGDDHRGADGYVVIAKNGVAQGRGERAENFAAAMGRGTDCDE